MNTTTILSGKICLILSVFLFFLAANAGATGKVNALTSGPAINDQALLVKGLVSDSTKNKVDKIIDTESPVFTTVPRNGFANSLEEVAFDLVMAVDNLTKVTITYLDVIDGDSNSGILTRTWTATDQSGNSSTASASVRYYGNDLDMQKEEQESKTTLFQNYPNPFSKKTSIPFYLSNPDFVTLKIYDASGQLLYTSSSNFEKGDNIFDLIASDLQTDGVMYYELITTKFKQTRKMVFKSNE